MKKFGRIKIIVLAVIIALAAALGVGCRARSTLAIISGTWRLDFALCKKNYDKHNGVDVVSVFKNVELTFSTTSMEVKIEFADDFIQSGNTCELKAGSYAIEFHSSDFDSMDIDYYRDDIDGNEFIEADESNGDFIYPAQSITGQIWFENNTMRLHSYIRDKDGNYLRDEDGRLANDALNLYFTKPGSPPTDSVGGDDDDKVQSRFTEIKAAYSDAGYIVDVGDDDLDSSTAAMVAQMKNSYSAMGYEMCVIGKNLDDAYMTSTELYMLFETPAENDAKELEDGFKDAYSCKRKGRDIIVYILPIGTANFEPFTQAVQ